MFRSLVAALLVAGCAPESGDPVPIACELRIEPELILGVQGLLFFLATVESPELPELSRVKYTVVVGDDPPIDSSQPNLRRTAIPEGFVSDDVWVLLDGDLGDHIGRRAHLTVTLFGDDRTCVSEGTADLINEDDCLHSFDGPICPDDD